MNRSPQRRVVWLVCATSCVAYLLVSLAHHQAFHPWGRLAFFDLRVYRGGAHLILSGGSLYDARIWHWAPFTYPPFAAIVFTPLALLPLALDEVLVTIFGLVALFAIVALALRLTSAGGAEAPRTERSLVVPAAAAAALWLEPVTATLGYGQINLLIALLIVGDLTRGDAARSKGALIGLAAGLKLTPLIFVAYLFFSRRRRAAFVALGTFAATVAVGYALLPADAVRYWGGTFLDSRRVGGCCVPTNQSLRGVILGIDPSFGSLRLACVEVVVGVLGLTLAVRAARRGDEALGFSLCAITGLLASPVSWSHHWTLAVPALLVIGVQVARERSKSGLIALAGCLLVGYSYLPKLMAKPGFLPGSHLSLAVELASGSYVLIGVAALGVACLREVRLGLATNTAHAALGLERGGHVGRVAAPSDDQGHAAERQRHEHAEERRLHAVGGRRRDLLTRAKRAAAPD